MALVFDYQAFTITVPKADMVLVTSTPTEIRELDIDVLRGWLLDEQDDPRGMPFPTMFANQPPTSISGVTLARVLEIQYPYTITFDDSGGADPYNVNIIGGNSNVSDVVNKNTVGVNTANSAGLQEPLAETIWNNHIVEGTVSAQDVMEVLLAIAAGKTNITDLGGGDATVVFRDQADSKDRVSASMTGSERTTTTLDNS